MQKGRAKKNVQFWRCSSKNLPIFAGEKDRGKSRESSFSKKYQQKNNYAMETKKENTNSPKTIVLNANQWEALRYLNTQKLGTLFKAIYKTILGKEVAEEKMAGDVLIAYKFMMKQINDDIERYERQKQKNRERQKRFYDKKMRAAAIVDDPFGAMPSEVASEEEQADATADEFSF